MFNCFKKEKKEEPKKGLELTATGAPYDIRYKGQIVGCIVKGDGDGLHRAVFFLGSIEWGNADLRAIADKLDELNFGENKNHE